MADGPVLADLHFGREDAERDVTEGLLLRGGFLPNAAYGVRSADARCSSSGARGPGRALSACN